MKPSFFLFIFLWITSFTKAQPTVNQFSEEYGSGKNLLLDFYQSYISPIDGSNCKMYPSCSQYAKIAFKQFGPIKAYQLATDRILRCGHDIHGNYELIQKEKEWFIADPVKSNFHPLTISTRIKTFTDTTKNFANFLLENEQYEAAKENYFKLLFNKSDSSNTDMHLTKIGFCMLKLNQHKELNSHYLKYFNILAPTYRNQLALYLTNSYYTQKDYEGMKITLSSLKSPNEKHKMGSYYYAGLAELGMKNYELAAVEMGKVNSNSEHFAVASKFIRIDKEIQELPKRSPIMAGLSSAILPGSGYLYSNKPVTALSAFVLNGLFAWSIYSSFNNNNIALGTTISVFASGWYFGSIRGAAKSVKNWNEIQKIQLINSKLY